MYENDKNTFVRNVFGISHLSVCVRWKGGGEREVDELGLLEFGPGKWRACFQFLVSYKFSEISIFPEMGCPRVPIYFSIVFLYSFSVCPLKNELHSLFSLTLNNRIHRFLTLAHHMHMIQSANSLQCERKTNCMNC